MYNSYGAQAEKYFLELMNKENLETSFEDSWYDFLVKNERVEVKSCALFVKQKKYDKRKYIYSSGRFHFTQKTNRILQYNENVWVAFIVRHKENFLFLGFVRARDLNMKKEITLSQLGKYKPLSLQDWIKKIN